MTDKYLTEKLIKNRGISMPESKLQAVLYLAEVEKEGITIHSTEGSRNWRMLSVDDLIKLAQKMWKQIEGV